MLKHSCGIVGIFSNKEINLPKQLFFPLFSLQHRGQESCGITYKKENRLVTYKDIGMVGPVLSHYLHKEHLSRIGIGHTRYSTSGGNILENAQPISIRCNKGEIALAHNGTLSNSFHLRHELFSEGSIFLSTTDTELILHMISRSKRDFLLSLKETLARLEGAFSLVLIHDDTLIAVRDPHGFRPLIIGKKDDLTALASESIALDMMGISNIREIKPGEMVIIQQKGLESIQYSNEKKHSQCIFELIYFARPDSTIFNCSVYNTRQLMGEHLAKMDDITPDLVIPVPDSGNIAALGYTRYSGVPFKMGLTRNHYTGRSFIQPTPSKRELQVKIKLHPVKDIIKGKTLVLIDDSIVRGTTSKIIVQLLRESGAKEIHLRLSSPPLTHPCFFGIDIPTKQELISHHMTPDQIAAHLGADSVKFLSLDYLRQCVSNPDDYCYACFNGEYPVKIDKELLNGCKKL
jgi:amidophosphoribosyltransferase